MAYIDKNGIQFNSFDSNASVFKKKLSNNQYLGASVDDLEDIANDNGGVLPTTINAVEIDWNGADLGNSYYINTTGEKKCHTNSAKSLRVIKKSQITGAVKIKEQII